MEDAGLLRTKVTLVHSLQGSSGLDLLLLLIIIELGLEFFLHQCRNTWNWNSLGLVLQFSSCLSMV